jgi:hypothetical protein
MLLIRVDRGSIAIKRDVKQTVTGLLRKIPHH